MAKVTISKKKTAEAPAPAPAPVVDIEASAEDFGDYLGDIGEDLLDELDTIGMSEIDDLGVSVEDVEAAMQSISPAVSFSAPAAPSPGISEAALSALSADVARILKAAESLNPAPIVESLEFQRAAIERVQGQIESLSQQVAHLAEFVSDSHKTLVQSVQARTVAPVAPKADTGSALDSFIRQQFDGLTAGKVYPADKVAEVFAKRNTGDAVAADKILARMQVVLADAFAKANREGYIAR